jgi:hypothetical protein
LRSRPLNAPAAFHVSRLSPSNRKDRKLEDSNDRQAYLRHRFGGRFRNNLFYIVRNCLSVRRKLERGGADHPGPLWKHPVWPRHTTADFTRPVDITSSVIRRSWAAVSPAPGMCRRTQWLARASPMSPDASGGFRAAGLGPVAARPVSAQASGTPLL